MKTYALVGTGARAFTFVEALTRRHAAASRLIAFCDSSSVRMAHHNDRLAAAGLAPVPTYRAEDFGRLLADLRPDGLVVTSVDATHDQYIVAGLEAGLEVVTEKPLTVDAPRCARILDAWRRHPQRFRVAFNYRYIPGCTRVKELLLAGTIGRVLSVNLEYLLDTRHGADYFRRWHSERGSSGGLLVHKATHHFDLVNWWLDAIPAEVFAFGRLAFYGAENARARGDGHLAAYPRYTGEPAAANDPFALDLRQPGYDALYHAAEAETGYLRDRNVFRAGIDIFDTMSAVVRYRTGQVLTYSLDAFSPREGKRVSFNGERGRLEYVELGGSHLIRGQSDAELAAEQAAHPGERRITVFPHFRPPYPVEIPSAEGGHGGSDRLLQEQLFGAEPPPERLGRLAGPEQGAASILVGIAANRSIDTGQPVRLDDLVSLAPQALRLSELT